MTQDIAALEYDLLNLLLKAAASDAPTAYVAPILTQDNVESILAWRDQRDRLVAALREVLLHWTPEHLDVVSGEGIGSRLAALLREIDAAAQGGER